MKAQPVWNALKAYAAHPDPLAATANLIALIVVSNQPFYPLYVYWAVGPDISPTLFTFLSTPFFAAVPAASRLSPVAGRAMLPLVGIANTALSAKAFGVASGVEIFLIPCVLIGFVLFRPSERIWAFAIAALALAVYFGLHGAYGQPFHAYSADEFARFAALNAMSAATLTVFVGILVSNLMAERAP